MSYRNIDADIDVVNVNENENETINININTDRETIRETNNRVNMKRNACCFCCKRYVYAITDYNSKIIETENEELQLRQNNIHPSLWNTYVGDALRVKFNICSLFFTTIGIVLSYCFRESDFVVISQALNTLDDTHKYSFLEINDVLKIVCNVVGVGMCIYAVRHWYNKHKMNYYVIIAWFLFAISIFIQIVIPPYYIMDVVYSSIGENIVGFLLSLLEGTPDGDGDGHDDASATTYDNQPSSGYSGYSGYSEYATMNYDTSYDTSSDTKIGTNTELLEKIVETYSSAVGNCIVFIVMLPFMFRNNALQISRVDASYRKIAKVLHIILSFTEIFISIMGCNIIFLFGSSNYWVVVCFAVFYNVLRQTQYFYNISWLENILLLLVAGFGVVLILVFSIPIDRFIVNFCNSYFINKTAINSIIYSKNKKNSRINRQDNEENSIELV